MLCGLVVYSIHLSIMIIGYYIFVLTAIWKLATGQNNTHSRQRRYLLFTKETQWGVFATVSVPLEPGSTVSVAWFFEANYYNVDNSSYFDPLLGDITIPRGRQERDIELRDDFNRFRLYTLIESMLENDDWSLPCRRINIGRYNELLLPRHGYPGRPCLLRAICENATTHFLHNGLLGDLIHLILTPSRSMLDDDIEDFFYEAEYKGLEIQCEDYIEKCSSNPLDTISAYLDGFL